MRSRCPRVSVPSAIRARTFWMARARRRPICPFEKIFTFTERVNMEFRAEAFNAFNHPAFWCSLTTTSPDGPGAAGVITSTVIPQRQFQFGLKLHF